MVDGSGFVRRSEVLAGNFVEGEVLQGALQRPDWLRLCVRLEQLLGPLQSLIPATVAPAVDQEAQRIAAQLLTRQVSLRPGAANCPAASRPL